MWSPKPSFQELVITVTLYFIILSCGIFQRTLPEAHSKPTMAEACKISWKFLTSALLGSHLEFHVDNYWATQEASLLFVQSSCVVGVDHNKQRETSTLSR